SLLPVRRPTAGQNGCQCQLAQSVRLSSFVAYFLVSPDATEKISHRDTVYRATISVQLTLLSYYNPSVFPPMPKRSTDVTVEDYRALAEFRYQLRLYLALSDHAARSAGLHPGQYRFLLTLKGLPDGTEPTISNMAERLGLRHHSTVELVD